MRAVLPFLQFQNAHLKYGCRKRATHARVFSQTHLHMGTARMKTDKETNEEGKKRGVSMEISTEGTKNKRCPRAYDYKLKI